MPDLLKCRIEDCHVIQHVVASPGVTEGDMGLLGDSTVYAWLETYATGVIGTKITEAERITLPAASAAVFAIGDEVYFDTSNLNLDESQAGRYRCGKALAAKAALETSVLVDFWGNQAEIVV
jgi:predicted RecA/RadA family phage recombinase